MNDLNPKFFHLKPEEISRASIVDGSRLLTSFMHSSYMTTLIQSLVLHPMRFRNILMDSFCSIVRKSSMSNSEIHRCTYDCGY